MNDAELIKFNDETRGIHAYLYATDDCYYFIEYTKGKRFDYSDANGFISNLKKSPLVRGTMQWQHKIKALNDAARTLRAKLPAEWRSDSTFVPIPPSKAKNHPEYDDRMTQILAKIGVDMRELVHQAASMAATHVSTQRHSVDQLAENYRINEDETNPEPTHIVIVDDMITAGSHFRAICKVLRRRFPKVPISGVFLARRVFPRTMKNPSGWAVVFDLDETLVLTSVLEPLRRTRRWGQVYAAFGRTKLPEGTLDFLKKVSRMAELGIVTKAPRLYAEKLIAYHNIEIPVLVAYHDVRNVKPDPEALLLASAKLGIVASKCIYVGDDRNDVQAARSAKFTPVGVCWGAQLDIGLASVCKSWDETYDEILGVIAG
jgi:HAD superfamily hydrolase (TIGR01549 family)